MKIAPCNFELYRFKVKTFFETQCSFIFVKNIRILTYFIFGLNVWNNYATWASVVPFAW